MIKRKAIIFGLKSINLSQQEKKLIKEEKPWGIILFSRNIRDLQQLKYLIKDIRKTIKDKRYPILIDEEGGRVSRIKNLIDTSLFTQKHFGDIYSYNKNYFNSYYKLYIDLLSDIFNYVGININTVPVLDVLRKNSHNIIGDRSYSSNPIKVAKIGKICVDAFKKNKIATVIKHIPGHGLSKTDSHYKTPTVNTNKKNLIKNDFMPFKKNTSLFAMTAHILYKNYDPDLTATHSKFIINKIVREHIGFKGILISDDISMKSLKYGLKDNATKALKAGCNLVLHCNGNIKEMYKLSKIIPLIDIFTSKKTSQFYKFLG